MSSVTGYFNDAASAGQAGYGLYNQIDRALHGDRTKVHFVQGNVTVIEFDIVLNEGHQFTVSPTQFPIEYGGVISDHSTVAPIQLSLTGLVSDYPVETRNQLLNSTTTAVLTAATTPLGAVGVLGATVGYSALAAQRTSISRSAKIFDDLQRITGIATQQRPVAKVQLFDVVTRLRRYPSMQVTSLALNRDSTSGPSNMVFSLTLQQVQVAYARHVTVQTAIPSKAGRKQTLGEGEEKESPFAESAAAGKAAGHAATDAPTDWALRNLPGTD
jgi:hypothetical protein